MGRARITRKGVVHGMGPADVGDDISKVEVEKRRAPGLLGGL